MRSRKGGDQVIVKLYSDTDADGRFSKDELIFRVVAADDGIYDRLNGSTAQRLNGSTAHRGKLDGITKIARLA